MNNKNIFIALIIVALAAGFVLCINNEPAGEAEVDSSDPNPTMESTDYIGKTTANAEAQAEINAEVFRVVEIDGEAQPVTKDLRPGRINAVVEDGVVVSYTVEVANPPMDEVMETEATDNDVIIGMTTEAAEAYAEANDIMFRVGMIDKEPLPVTMDYRIGRITAEVEDGVIVGYSVEK